MNTPASQTPNIAPNTGSYAGTTPSFKRRTFSKKGGWFRMPNEIFEFLAETESPANALAVYAYLSYRANNSTQRCYPSTSRIAGDVGISRSSVSKAIQVLRKRRIVAVEYRSGTSNSYVFLDKQHWSTQNVRPVVLSDNPRSSNGQVSVATKHTNKTKHSDLFNKAKNSELYSQKSLLKSQLVASKRI